MALKIDQKVKGLCPICFAVVTATIKSQIIPHVRANKQPKIVNREELVPCCDECDSICELAKPDSKKKGE